MKYNSRGGRIRVQEHEVGDIQFLTVTCGFLFSLGSSNWQLDLETTRRVTKKKLWHRVDKFYPLPSQTLKFYITTIFLEIMYFLYRTR